MCFSQNVRFSGAVPVDDTDPHPPGRALATFLEQAVRSAGWDVVIVEDWRDCGWSITSVRDTTALDVIMAQMDPPGWMVQIAPSETRFVKKLLGWVPSAERSDVHELACHIDAALAGRFGARRWCWDGCPDDTSAAHPQPWSGRD